MPLSVALVAAWNTSTSSDARTRSSPVMTSPLDDEAGYPREAMTTPTAAPRRQAAAAGSSPPVAAAHSSSSRSLSSRGQQAPASPGRRSGS